MIETYRHHRAVYALIPGVPALGRGLTRAAAIADLRAVMARIGATR